MDTTIDNQEWKEEDPQAPLAGAGQEDDPDAVVAFRNLLRTCCMLSDDRQFWRRLEAGIQDMERSMTPERLIRFEYAVDRVLVFHGLSAWSVVKSGIAGLMPAVSAPSGNDPPVGA